MYVALIVKQSSPSVWFSCLLASILPSVLNSLSFFYIAITQKQWIKLPIRKEGSKSILHEESVTCTPSAYLIKKNTEKITGFGLDTSVPSLCARNHHVQLAFASNRIRIQVIITSI